MFPQIIIKPVGRFVLPQNNLHIEADRRTYEMLPRINM